MASAWIRKLFQKTPRTPLRKARAAKPAPARRRLHIESLEDRVVPTVALTLDAPFNAPFLVVEGTSTTVTGKWLDFNPAATSFDLVASGLPSNLTYSDFSFTTDSTAPFPNGTFQFKVGALDGTITPPPTPAASPFNIIATNDLGEVTSPTAVSPRVQNVVPSFTATGPNQVVFTNQTKTFNLGAFTDPGLDSPWTVYVDWNGDGVVYEDSFSVTSKGQLSASHTFTTAGTYSVNVKLMDKDGGNSTVSTFTITVADSVATTYVDDDWAGATPGDIVGGHIYGFDAWAKIQDAMNKTTAGGTVNVAAGNYAENLVASKAVSLIGPNAGISGSNLARAPEATIQSAGPANAVVLVTASNVTVQGFAIDGDAVTTGASVYSGADSDTFYGISNYTAKQFNPPSFSSPVIYPVSGMKVLDNIIQHTAVGVYGEGKISQAGLTGNQIAGNLLQDIGQYDYGYGVTLRNNFYADVTDNVMRRVYTGIHINNFSNSPGGAPASWKITGNDITSYGGGAWFNQAYSGATALTVDDNTFAPATTDVNGDPLAPAANNIGIIVTGGPGYTGGTFTNNTISGHDYGLVVWGTSPAVTFNGTNTITNNGVGVYVTNNVGFNPHTSSTLGLVGTTTSVVLDGLNVSGSKSKGVWVRGDAGGGAVSVTLDGVTITASATTTAGLTIDGPQATLAGATLADTTFTSFAGTSQYVVLTNSAYAGAEIDGKSATYNGVVGGGGPDTDERPGHRRSHHARDRLEGHRFRRDAGRSALRPGRG